MGYGSSKKTLSGLREAGGYAAASAPGLAISISPLAAIVAISLLTINQDRPKHNTLFKVPRGAHEIPQPPDTPKRQFITTASTAARVLCAESFEGVSGIGFTKPLPVERTEYEVGPDAASVQHSNRFTNTIGDLAIVTCNYPNSSPKEIQEIPIQVVSYPTK